jgi:hypothetical protein
VISLRVGTNGANEVGTTLRQAALKNRHQFNRCGGGFKKTKTKP